MSLDKKQFGIKEVVQLIVLVFSLSGMYYTLDSRVTSLEANEKSLKTTVEENAETLKVIYFGLVAKGIIDPPK